jgi:hypothetical protein
VVLEKLPERVRTPAVARAMFSPSATLLAGAGMAGVVLAGAPLAIAAVAGAAVWAARVALAVPRKPKEMRVDARAVHEPWRTFVLDAVDARRRFEVAVRRSRPGPLHDRLGDLGRRLDDAVQEVWRIARQGDALQGGIVFLDVDQVQSELADLQQQPRTPGRDRAVESLKSQLGAAQRLAKVADDAVDRLRALNAQLDESVARAVELSIGVDDSADLSPLADQVESVVSEMESLRTALEETDGTPAASAGGGL